MNEKQLWQKVRAALQADFFLQRVENLVGEGVPDVIYHSRSNGRCGFIELKSRDKFPARENTPVFSGQHGLRPAQIAWIHCRAETGARVWVLAQCGGEMFLVHGRLARRFNLMTEEDLRKECEGGCVFREAGRTVEMLLR
jgi:hypothetical protein